MLLKYLNPTLLVQLSYFQQITSVTLSGTIETLLWPQLRSDISNRLVSNGAAQASDRFSAAEEAYRQVFSGIQCVRREKVINLKKG